MNKTKTETFLFYFILFLATFVRLYKLSEIPLGLDADEALSGYEAFSLLTTGHDSWGYRFPLYFIFWGKGTTVLYAYSTIPFIACLGLNAVAIRLPQVLFGLLSCYVFYRLLRLMFSRPVALFGFFLVAIIPWQILQARTGLEIKIAPFFVLTGFYFFVKSFKNKDYLLLSAVFYGLSLYTYGVVWIYTTLTFGFELSYLLWYKRDKSTLLTVLTSGIIFTLFAFPIILLTLINLNFIPEIRTDYFSIPKLPEWRGSEIDLQISTNFKRIFLLILLGQDEFLRNAFPPYGIFYPISVPFIFIGIYSLCSNTLKDIKKHEISINFLILINIITGIFYSLTFYPNINRCNFLWYNILITIVYGIYPFIIKPYFRNLFIPLYLVFFICFSYTFLKKFNFMEDHWFSSDLESAISIAEQNHAQSTLPIKIIDNRAIHPKILFFTKTHPNTFLETVRRRKKIQPPVASFTHFYFNPYIDYEHPSPDAIYIAPAERLPFFHEFNTRVVGTYLVATPKQTN